MIRTICFLFCISMVLQGANELTVVPSPGMPVTNINGVPAIDLSQIPTGSLVSYDIWFKSVDFDFAACEFKIYYPFSLFSLSDEDSHWVNNAGAVFAPGPLFADALVLPIDDTGNRIAPNVAINPFSVRVGLVFTNGLARWRGSPQNPHPGGMLGTIRFYYNGTATCTSLIESVQVLLSPNYTANHYDYFSDSAGNRVPIVSTAPVDIHGLEGEPGYLGQSGKNIRADANRDGVRGASDALTAAMCALNGQDACAGGIWTGIDQAEYLQTFDYNCDGSVGAADALGLAKLALGMRERSSATSMAVSLSSGNVTLSTTENGVLAITRLQLEGLDYQAPVFVNDELGWTLLYESNGPFLDIMVVRTDNADGPVPTVQIPFQRTARTAGTVLLHQGATQTSSQNPIFWEPTLEVAQ